MKHDPFDEALRSRAQAERFDTSPEADARLERAIRRGLRARPRPTRLAPLMAGAAACLAAAALWLTQPPADRVSGNAPTAAPARFETVLPLASGAQEVRSEAHATVENGVWRAEASFSNGSQEIYLVSWSVDTDETLLEAPDALIWLEPGASCTDRAAWPAEGEEAPAWRYTAYRVAAGVLHWMDGDWLRPGEDGYAAQQALITDAYENGALVLAPGDWENGMAGEMALVLPDAMGNVSALETYLTAGLLVEESGGEARMGAEARP